jgi:hypothetical protein
MNMLLVPKHKQRGHARIGSACFFSNASVRFILEDLNIFCTPYVLSGSLTSDHKTAQTDMRRAKRSHDAGFSTRQIELLLIEI